MRVKDKGVVRTSKFFPFKSQQTLQNIKFFPKLNNHGKIKRIKITKKRSDRR